MEALSGLVADGLAKAYTLSSRVPNTTPLEGMPPVDVVEEYFRTYFLITEKGMEVHLADANWWPFDEIE